MEMREVFGQTLVELAEKNERIIVLDADLNTSTKTDIFKAHFPDRFLQLGIAEQNMFGWAAGLATLGFIPFPTTFAAFASTRAADQIRVSIAYPRLNVKIAGSYPGVSGDKGGASHASVEDLAIMRSIPNMQVLAPADEIELRQALYAMVDYPGPVYFRVTKFRVPPVFDSGYVFDGKPVLLREGSDVTLIGTGYMTHKCVEAAKLLELKGISASVIHVPCLKPLDRELLVEASSLTRAVVTAEDHNILGGLGSAVAEVLSEEVPCYIERVGIRDEFLKSGDETELGERYGLRPQDIANAAKMVIDKRESAKLHWLRKR